MGTLSVQALRAIIWLSRVVQVVIVDIDVMLARREMPVGVLAERIGITPANLAVLKNGRARAVRFSTLAALCEVLDCQPGDLLRWEPGSTEGDDV